MDPTSVAFFKVLLNKYALGGNETLLKFLPKADSDAVLKSKTSSQNVAAGLAWRHEIFAQTHYSWIAPIVKELPPAEQQAVLASLPEGTTEKIKKLLGISTDAKIHAPQLQKVWLHHLYGTWRPAEALPPQYLEPTPLTPLLSLTKDQLVLLIDLLALNDLAEAIRHIVDKNTLKIIYGGLDHNEQAFLRICLHHRDKLKIPKIDVTKLKDTPEVLKRTLHKRGMLRLGKALCGQSHEFLWHVTHILDTGRGTALQVHYAEQPIAGVTAMLAQQTVTAINFINESTT